MKPNTLFKGALCSLPLWAIIIGVYYLYPKLPDIIRLPGDVSEAAESSPIVVDGQPVIMVSHHFDGLTFHKWSGEVFKKLDFNYEYAAAVNDGEDILVTGSNGNEVAIQRLNASFQVMSGHTLILPYKVFNTSLVKSDMWVMAVEVSEVPGRYAIRFIQSADLKSWSPVGGRFPKEKGYAAAPSLKYEQGVYSLFYTVTEKLPHKIDGLEYGFKTCRVTSRDLVNFSSPQVILEPKDDEGVNNSDMDFAKVNGTTYITYDIGTQKDVGHIRRGIYAGKL